MFHRWGGSQPESVGAVAEDKAAEVDDAVFPSVDHEAMQVSVGPTERDLQGGVQLSDHGPPVGTSKRRQIS
jgi:hypothetical protein